MFMIMIAHVLLTLSISILSTFTIVCVSFASVLAIHSARILPWVLAQEAIVQFKITTTLLKDYNLVYISV